LLLVRLHIEDIDHDRLVTVVVGLEGTSGGDTEVLGLLLGEGGELDTNTLQVVTGDLLIELLGEKVDTNGVLVGLSPEGNLSEDLVAERGGHNERRVSTSAAKVDETAGGEEDEVTARGKEVTVDLRLNVNLGRGVGVQPGNINLAIEVANVADDGILGHDAHVSTSDDIGATGCGDEDVSAGSGIVHGDDLITLHGGLESIDGVNLSDENTGTHATERVSATLSDVTISGDNGGLTSNHNVGGALDTVQKGLTASVQVVELGLGDGVVDVDGGELELALLHHLVEVVNTSGGLLGNTADTSKELGVLLVNDVGKISTVVQDHVKGLAIGEDKGLLNTPDVLLLGLTLPRVNGNSALGNGGGGGVDSGVDVAAGPLDLGTQSNQSQNELSGLGSHVERTSNTGSLQGLGGAVTLADLNETGHLILGNLNLVLTKLSQADISNLRRRKKEGGQ
jgi:hypothetical protein